MTDVAGSTVDVMKNPAPSDTGDGSAPSVYTLPSSPLRSAILVLLTSLTMTVLDGVCTNLALPSMARDFGVEPSRAVWIVTTYQLALVIGLLPFASLGEIYGYRWVFLGGLLVFTTTSAINTMAGSIDALTIGRAIQGLGSSAVMSVFPALIRNSYPANQFGRAVGNNALTVALSTAMAPTVASAILAFGPWPWLYAVNVPIGAFALVLGWRVLPHVPPVARRFDLLSAAMWAVTIAAVVLGLEALGTAPAQAAIALVIASLVGFFLFRRASAQPAPLVPLDLMRLPPFAYAVATSIGSFAAQSVAYVALPFHLQHHFNRSLLATGLLMTAWPAAAAVSAPLAGRFADRIAAWKLCAPGSALLGCGLFGLLCLPGSAPDWLIVVFMLVCGTGFGMFQTPNNHTLLLSAPRDRGGSAGGMQGLSRQLGMMTGSTTVMLSFGGWGEDGALWAMGFGVFYAMLGAALSLARGRYGELRQS